MVSHSLMVLTLPRLFLAPATGGAHSESVQALEQGADIESVVGPLATVIDLHSIKRVQLDLVQNSLRIEYINTLTGKASTAIRFASSEIADAAFSKLWRRLGQEYRLQPYRPEPYALAQIPIIAILTVLLTTAFLAIAMNVLQDVPLFGNPTWASMLPGWKVICSFGGAVAALITVWLHRRLTSPPERLVLIRD